MDIYGFTVKDSGGADVDLGAYRGKVLLVVNTATRCGLTPQYKGLEALYQAYRDQGFEILDFPCNQFREQAPGTDAEITEFCTLNYGTTFPRFQKIDVNGEHAAPLYTWLKAQAPKDQGGLKAKAFGAIASRVNKGAPGKASDVRWNFGKFLVGRDGRVAGRFAPTTDPKLLRAEIEKLL